VYLIDEIPSFFIFLIKLLSVPMTAELEEEVTLSDTERTKWDRSKPIQKRCLEGCTRSNHHLDETVDNDPT